MISITACIKIAVAGASAESHVNDVIDCAFQILQQGTQWASQPV